MEKTTDPRRLKSDSNFSDFKVIFWLLLFFAGTVAVDLLEYKYNSLEKEENRPTKSVEQVDSLAAVYLDLERKVEILNRYLLIKHIEYMEVCNLVYSPTNSVDYKHE